MAYEISGNHTGLQESMIVCNKNDNVNARWDLVFVDGYHGGGCIARRSTGAEPVTARYYVDFLFALLTSNFIKNYIRCPVFKRCIQIIISG